MIVECAAARHESRGLHFTIDHVTSDAKLARDMIMKRGVAAHFAPGAAGR